MQTHRFRVITVTGSLLNFDYTRLQQVRRWLPTVRPRPQRAVSRSFWPLADALTLKRASDTSPCCCAAVCARRRFGGSFRT